jgi:hypothetical protein
MLLICRPLRGLNSFIDFTWGCARKASLHPRLYAQRPLRGLNYAEDQAQQNYAGSGGIQKEAAAVRHYNPKVERV